MLEDLLDGGALGRVELEDQPDQVLQVFRQVGVDVVLPLLDFSRHRLQGGTPERGEPVQHLEQEDAQSPDIDAVVVLVLQDHLRSHVFVRSAEGRPLGVDVHRAPAEVAEFEVEAVVQEEVFGLSLRDGLP